MNNFAVKLAGFLVLGALLWWNEQPRDTALVSQAAQPAAAKLVPTPQPTGSPKLPATWLEDKFEPPRGRTVELTGTAATARGLQAALDQAQPGDEIVLPAGLTFTGNFVLPAKSGTQWITLRTSALNELPPAGTRLTPELAARLPKLVTPNADAALKTAPGAHHYRLLGLEITVAPGVAQNHGLLLLGDGSSAQRTLAQVPHDLLVERCYIHGQRTGNVSRGVALNSARTAVLDSYLSECHGVGYDTQAIGGWNGPGPYKIVNNYLEGAGENVLIGGADPAIPGLVPADIEFRGNRCFKPLHWKADDPSFAGQRWAIKNLFELKNARRVLIDGNLFEHNWVDAQNGFAILFTVANQDGNAPWSVVEDVTFTNNVVRRVAAGVNVLGRDYAKPSGQAARILIANNLFEEVGAPGFGTNGRFLQLTDTISVTVDHNTILHTGNLIMGYGQPNQHFVFTNNVARHNEYGVIGEGTGPGANTLAKYFPGAVFKRNLLAGGPSHVYPADNFFPANFDPAGGGQRGTDGKALGAAIMKVSGSLGAPESGRPKSP
jgi:hypothetical protein